LIVLPIQEAFGWRAAFRILGAIGLVWALVWYGWYRDEPAAPPGVTDEDRGEPGASPNGHHGSLIPWRLLLRSGQLWLILGMYFCYAWGSWFYFSWLHTYLVKGRGFSEKEMGVFSSLPFILGALGNVGGGFLGDALARRFGLRTGRRLVGSLSLTATALLLIATALTPAQTMVIVFLTIGFGVMDLMLPAAWAICLDMAPRYAGAVTGAMNMSGQFGGFLCTVLFGYVVERSGSYQAPLFLIALMLLCSAFLFTRIDPTRPLIEEGMASTG
jgi:predicted MFS family arabinose efflux permease